MKTTWRELKEQGVKRCSAVFVSGKQCRSRANSKGSWCDKHAKLIEPIVARANKAIEAGCSKPESRELSDKSKSKR